jgi:hypothetical protein
MWMRGRGYNADTLGPSGTGPHSQIEALLRKQAESEQAPTRLVLCQQFCRSAKRRPAAPAGRSRWVGAAEVEGGSPSSPTCSAVTTYPAGPRRSEWSC